MNKKLSTVALGRLSEAEFKETEKLRVVILLENIRSMNNIGSVFRSADAFLVEAIFLCGYTALPPHRDIQKTALGATETVKWKHFEKISDAIVELKSNGYKLVAIEQTENSLKLHQTDFRKIGPIALIFGNEVKGVEQNTIELCDSCLEIEQYGTKHSLNVSVCAGIVLWKIASDLKN
jgi:23S rRNA (guanosine2251-2'-O)-methyltransferase